MCRSIVFIVLIAIFQNEIQETFQSKLETVVPTTKTDKTSDTEPSPTNDEFIDKPKDTTEKYEDLDKSIKSIDVADISSNESNGTKITNPISIDHNTMDDKVTKDVIEDTSTNKVHEKVSNNEVIIPESTKSFESLNGDTNTNNNNGKDTKDQSIRTAGFRRSLDNGGPIKDVTKTLVSYGDSFSTFPPDSFLQRLAGRMLIPMLKVHQQFSGGLSKGVHGIQEVGSGTLDIAEGTFNLFKDAARSILKT